VLAKRQPGDSVKLTILRDRKTLEIDVVLARREALFEER
jgi:S1-C subfamily serine protease